MRTTEITPEIKVLLEDFGADLYQVMSRAGRPYRWLEDQARESRGVPLPKASLWRIIHGQAKPDWRVVAQVLILLGVAEETINEQWRRRWDALMDQISAIERRALVPVLRPTETECATCGAVVVNLARHEEWHADLAAAYRRSGLRSVPTPRDIDQSSLAS